jgi:Fe-S-cluster containining protein
MAVRRRRRKKSAKEKLDKNDKDVCIKCPSICCHDLTYTISRPRTRADIEELKWDLQYDTVKVFIRNRRWYELIKGRCMYLTESNLCSRYEDRPDKCRNHMPPACEQFGEYYDVLISTPEELEDYLIKKQPL